MRIIAEICQNHNGSFQNLKEMVDAACEGGAHIAKIQALYSEELVYREQFEGNTTEKFSMFRPYEAEFARLSSLDLSEEEEENFVEYCLFRKIVPMITVFTNKGVERAKLAGFKHIKIASYDSTNLSLIESTLDFAKEIFISTGATTELEVESLIQFLLLHNKKNKITLLHCKTEYPNMINRVNLLRMKWLDSFGFEVGFSDHSQTYSSEGIRLSTRNIASKAAIILGAKVIERHFSTLSPAETKDGKISIKSDDIKELINFYKNENNQQLEFLENYKDEILLIKGNGSNFEPSVEEWWNRQYYKGRVRSKKIQV